MIFSPFVDGCVLIPSVLTPPSPNWKVLTNEPIIGISSNAAATVGTCIIKTRARQAANTPVNCLYT